MRLALVVLAGVVALLCVGGAGVVLVAYQRAAAPDRSAPDVVVDNYLRAYLVERNDVRASLYSCKDASELSEVQTLRNDIQAREKQYAIKILVSWGSLHVAVSDKSGTVTTQVRRTVSDGSERVLETWRFDVANQGGWRVCGAHRLS